MFPLPTENISPPIFSFGGNQNPTCHTILSGVTFVFFPLHQSRVPLRFFVPRLTEVISNRPTQIILMCQFYLDIQDTLKVHMHKESLE